MATVDRLQDLDCLFIDVIDHARHGIKERVLILVRAPERKFDGNPLPAVSRLHADGRAGVINSLWFWGFGELPPVPGKPLESVCNSLLCNSFVRACDADSAPADASVFVTDSCLEGRRYGDMQLWISGLAETEQRLRELLELRGTQLYLQSDNGFAVRYRSSMRFRFWQSRNFAKLVQSQASDK